MKEPLEKSLGFALDSDHKGALAGEREVQSVLALQVVFCFPGALVTLLAHKKKSCPAKSGTRACDFSTLQLRPVEERRNEISSLCSMFRGRVQLDCRPQSLKCAWEMYESLRISLLSGIGSGTACCVLCCPRKQCLLSAVDDAVPTVQKVAQKVNWCVGPQRETHSTLFSQCLQTPGSYRKGKVSALSLFARDQSESHHAASQLRTSFR